MGRIQLTVRPGPDGPSLVATKISSDSVSSDTMTLDDYRTFRLFMFHLFLTMIDGSDGLRFGKLVRINDPLKDVLYFLYVDIAKLVAPTLSEPHEQLEQTALALCLTNATVPLSFYSKRRIDLAKWHNVHAVMFFDWSAVQRVTPPLPQLLKLTLNAVTDLNKIKQIVNRTPPEDLTILLSASGTAAIDHLREKNLTIERAGTPFQMALYGGDEDIVTYLKPLMGPAEVERQSKEVFRNALPPEKQEELDAQNAPALAYYNAMLIVQKANATKLCNEALQFDINYNQVLINAETIADFQKELTDYVRNNPIHNPFILLSLYKIGLELPRNSKEACLFAERIIGHAHALSSARWLQHYAQGIYYLPMADYMPERTHRSFMIRRTPLVDVRSLIPHLGVNSYMGILGLQRTAKELNAIEWDSQLKEFCKAKTTFFQNLLDDQDQYVRKLTSNGVVR